MIVLVIMGRLNNPLNRAFGRSEANGNLLARYHPDESTNLRNHLWREVIAVGAAHVDKMRHRLQVVRVYARTISAQVVEFHAVRNLTSMSLVDNPMGPRRDSVAAPANNAVSVGPLASLPIPAPCFSVNDVFQGRFSAVVAMNVSHGTSAHNASAENCSRRNRCSLAASTLAQSGRIRISQSSVGSDVACFGGARATSRASWANRRATVKTQMHGRFLGHLDLLTSGAAPGWLQPRPAPSCAPKYSVWSTP